MATALMLISAVCSAQSTKIAYVNSDKILQEIPEYLQVKKELEKMSKDLQDAIDDYRKKEAMLDADAKARKQKDFQDMQQKAQDYQLQRFSPIQERVMNAIKKVAKKGGYNYVFDKLDTGTNILFADQKFDITYKVIDILKTDDNTPAKTDRDK